MLKAVFEQHGPVDDVVTFPGRMYAFVNFQHADDAARAQESLDGKEVPLNNPALSYQQLHSTEMRASKAPAKEVSLSNPALSCQQFNNSNPAFRDDDPRSL